jgi:hypothetical protein
MQQAFNVHIKNTGSTDELQSRYEASFALMLDTAMFDGVVEMLGITCPS